MNYDSITCMLEGMVNTNTCPSMLFYGPPGSGKSTTASILGKMLYPSDSTLRVMNINASDERGVGVIREKIVTFIGTNILSQSVSQKVHPTPGVPSIHPLPLQSAVSVKKMVILDEVDYMIPDAQIGLSELMDENKDILFLFICNYIQKIQPNVLSRVLSVRFSKPSVGHLEKIIGTKMKKHNMSYSKNTIPVMCKLSRYDIRKVSYMADVLSMTQSGSINMTSVYKYSQYPSEKSISTMLRKIKVGEYKHNNTSAHLFKMVDGNGVRIEHILTSIYTLLKHSNELNIPFDRWSSLVSELARIETMLTYDPFPQMMMSHLAACIHTALV